MKKAYSLDYDIYYATDRCSAVHTILNNLDSTPNQTDLEQMADYILFGKDQKLLSAVDTKDIMSPKRRFNSYTTKADQNESLNALMEDPITAQDVENNARPVGKENKSPYRVLKQEIHRTKYDEDGNIISRGDDFDNEGNVVPFMRDLWKSIDKWQARIDMYKGNTEPDEWVLSHPKTNYKIYQLNHFLIDLRRHQYYIKDSYNPPIHFFNTPPPGTPHYDLQNNTGLWLSAEEWCARKRNPKPYDLPQPNFQDAPRGPNDTFYWAISENKLDYENPYHIRALIANYVKLLRRSYAHPDSDLRQICWDLERLVEESHLTDLEQFILEGRVANRPLLLLMKVLENESIDITFSQLCHISRQLLPKKLAATAKRLRLESDVTTGKLRGIYCPHCGKTLPADSMFFTKNKNSPTGFSNVCKKCSIEIRKKRKNSKPPEVKL